MFLFDSITGERINEVKYVLLGCFLVSMADSDLSKIIQQYVMPYSVIA